jgi:hypothetical protein
MRTVLGFASTGTERPIIAKGNAGIPKYHDGHIHYDGTPELMAEYAVLARDAGVRIIGGCCGTMPEHLRAMREALETGPRARVRRWRISPPIWAGSPLPRTGRATPRAIRSGSGAGGGGDPARGWQQVEGALVFTAALAIYGASDQPFSWWLALILFFAPDLSFFAYLAGPKVGGWDTTPSTSTASARS